jgi:hypothetical protein
LRDARLALSTRPFLARGGPKGERCASCRLRPSHCLCAFRPQLPTHAGVCLLMHDAEPLKPSNTGWLIADVVAQTFAFGWSRTQPEPALLALLADPQWLPHIVFPGEFVQPASRVLHEPMCQAARAAASTASTAPTASTPAPSTSPTGTTNGGTPSGASPARPLFVLLDATWPEARKMFRKSPMLDAYPVLSFTPEQASRYRLRRSKRTDLWCTSEVAAMCLSLMDDPRDQLAAQALQLQLDVYTQHHLAAKHQRPPDLGSAAHQQLRALLGMPIM